MTGLSGTNALSALPQPVQDRLEELRAGLESLLGLDLRALLVHGSAVRGEYREGQSDIDVVVVLREASQDRLQAIAHVLQLARYAARIEAIVLTSQEIPRAADVFPLFYDEIRECHVVLSGVDPFSGLSISDRHRRLRIEQELREAQIRLRRMLLDAMGQKEALGGAVQRKLRQLRGPLHALLRLRGEICDSDLSSVLRTAARTYGIDPAPLSRAQELPDEAYRTLAALLHAAVDDADRRDEEGR